MTKNRPKQYDITAKITFKYKRNRYEIQKLEM